ncbi:hypothetical protein QFZ55_000407 [Streptomyces luteogriseus]|uniref:hypothetical protein n=1 Tax=Streptomyces luteogriseus TaxID=68233 RepID=UPI0027873778|nr:hypothetical protein [Streptomyces luteogriseus]MDQ0710955.1 hypothetical protein [Streptomyces luteogriseus]
MSRRAFVVQCTSPPARCDQATFSTQCTRTPPAARASSDSTRNRSRPRPADVTASQCIAGGGMIVISAVGDVSQGYTKRRMGGVHDGQTVL